MLWYYADGYPWKYSSQLAVEVHDQGGYMARQVRKWTRAFIEDRHQLPVSFANTWNTSVLDNEDFEQALLVHLQGLGKYICAADIVAYLAQDNVQERFGLTDTISLSTAQAWMHGLGYRWKKSPNGQYVDGHEREDVVHYRQGVYLPALNALRPRLRQYDPDGNECSQGAPDSSTNPPSSTLPPTAESEPVAGPERNPSSDLPSPASESTPPPEGPSPAAVRPVRLLWHDESIFYANDRRVVYWVQEGAKAVPRAKGEGASMMISDFFSAEDGWLRSQDGQQAARRLFRPGKNRDGYFTNADVIEQFEEAADIAQARWPDEDIVFVLDNAPTHLKRAPDALSARQMTKGPSHTFGIDVSVLDENSKPVYGSDGKILKTRIRMADATLPGSGTPQSLYFPDDYPDVSLRGAFKGMTVLLKERGYHTADRLRAQCDGFHCPPPPPGSVPLEFYMRSPCCSRRLLYEQPDFQSVKSLLEIKMESRGVQCLFLPKFHCELNPIEQCWGYAKRIYRMNPTSSKEADLEKNLVESINAVPLTSMRRFYTRALRFADAYSKGLSGKQAAWATKKYRGHRVIPETIFEELTHEGITAQ
ncbi:hypothetical protein K466DRAFT_574542 [Polyporus arcularius HHB13444]|uniref:Tc1-like transposase DDE domain-containing protein n=1 Tax=Polyporus arcularius HHB13444 TaxID=1314778 RepID=A0A5C3PKV0_9APHY|nr:hypothetical protein K466DRAFT_574542 [Polyporus arcularius HHB13444]